MDHEIATAANRRKSLTKKRQRLRGETEGPCVSDSSVDVNDYCTMSNSGSPDVKKTTNDGEEKSQSVYAQNRQNLGMDVFVAYNRRKNLANKRRRIRGETEVPCVSKNSDDVNEFCIVPNAESPNVKKTKNDGEEKSQNVYWDNAQQ